MLSFFSTLHELMAIVILGSAIYIWFLENKNKTESAEKTLRLFKKEFLLTRIVGMLVVLMMLIGGYLGTPFFKAKAGWIFIKIFLVIVFAGFHGAFGLKNMRLRMKAFEEGKSNEDIQLYNAKTQKFVFLQVILIVIVMIIAYKKTL